MSESPDLQNNVAKQPEPVMEVKAIVETKETKVVEQRPVTKQAVVNFDGSEFDDDWDEDSNAEDSEEPGDNENFEFDDEWDAL